MATRICVKRPYGQLTEYVPVERVEKLTAGETLFIGDFRAGAVSIPGPFSSRHGYSAEAPATEHRSVLVPAGELRTATVTRQQAANHRIGQSIALSD